MNVLLYKHESNPIRKIIKDLDLPLPLCLLRETELGEGSNLHVSVDRRLTWQKGEVGAVYFAEVVTAVDFMEM